MPSLAATFWQQRTSWPVHAAINFLLLAAGLPAALAGDVVLDAAPQARYYPTPDTYLPADRGADWSFAGYRDGDVPLPAPPVTYDVVRDFQARGDGVTDDTAALKAAVAAANSQPGAVFLPAGTYLLAEPLEVVAGGVVLRGAGEDETRIRIARSLSEVYPGTWASDEQGHVATQWGAWGGFITIRGTPEYKGTVDTWLAAVVGRVERGSKSIPVDAGSFSAGQWVRVFGVSAAGQELQYSGVVANATAGVVELDRPLPFAVDAGQGSVHRYVPTVQDSGIEKLTIEFSSAPYGAHETDRGYNAIFLVSAANVWVQQVTVLNADNSLLLHRVDHASVLDVTVSSTASRADPADSYWQRQGHHGISLADCHEVMVARFRVGCRMYHDLAVTDAAMLNVFTAGTGIDLNIHASAGPLANLFSDVDAGQGSRVFSSEGATSHGPGTTFFNVRSGAAAAATTRSAFSTAAEAAPPDVPLPGCEYGSDLNFFGRFNLSSPTCPGWLLAPLNDSLPADLWSEQAFVRATRAPLPEGAHRSSSGAAHTACRTFMGNPEDPIECWQLVYDHCIPGYTNRNAIPREIMEHERKVIQDLWEVASPSGSFGDPPSLIRPEYSRVCTAVPALVGSGNCGHVAAGDYRVHVPGFAPAGSGRCDNTPQHTSFVKAHVDAAHQFSVWGNVGH